MSIFGKIPDIPNLEVAEQNLSEEYFVKQVEMAAERINETQFALGLIMNEAIRFIDAKYADESPEDRAHRVEEMFKEFHRVTGKSTSTLRKYQITAKRYPPSVIVIFKGVDYTYFEELLAAPWYLRLELLEEIHDRISAGEDITKETIRRMIKDIVGEEQEAEKQILHKKISGKLIVTEDSIIIRRVKGDSIEELDLAEKLHTANGLDVKLTISFDINPESLTAEEYDRRLLTAEQVIESLEFEPVEIPDEEEEF